MSRLDRWQSARPQGLSTLPDYDFDKRLITAASIAKGFGDATQSRRPLARWPFEVYDGTAAAAMRHRGESAASVFQSFATGNSCAFNEPRTGPGQKSMVKSPGDRLERLNSLGTAAHGGRLLRFEPVPAVDGGRALAAQGPGPRWLFD